MMMRSVGYALSWEYWRRGMLWFVPAVAGVIVACGSLPTLIALSINTEPLAYFSEAYARMLNRGIVFFLCWGPFVLALASRTALRRLYALPISTAGLVGWHLANGSLAVVGLYALVAAALNGVCRTDWPLVGPACWSVAVYCAFQAMVWTIGQSHGRHVAAVYVTPACLVAAFLAAIALIVNVEGRLSERLPLDAGGVLRVYTELTAESLAVWLGTVGLSLAVAIAAVARDRRNESWPWMTLVHRWFARRAVVPQLQGRASHSATARTFRSPRRAQFWFEWRSKGRLLPLALGCLMGLLWLGFVLLRVKPDDVINTLAAVGGMLLMLSPFIGLFLGHVADRFDLRSFAATRPLSDGAIASAVLRSVAASLGCAATVWLAGILLTSAIWYPAAAEVLNNFRWGDLPREDLYRAVALGVFAMLAPWTLAGLGAALALARSWFVVAGGISVVGLFTCFILVTAANEEVGRALFASLCLGATVAAFLAVRRRHLVSTRTVLACLAGYVLLVAFFHASPDLANPTLAVHFQGAGLCALPFAPLAAAPLALSWNRHR
ncbi:MAG: hypothetical protein MUF48_23735 [Pirellulaceae bacterium]|nr:hypothetical protein [Pirellulaceae bacterium]